MKLLQSITLASPDADAFCDFLSSLQLLIDGTHDLLCIGGYIVVSILSLSLCSLTFNMMMMLLSHFASGQRAALQLRMLLWDLHLCTMLKTCFNCCCMCGCTTLKQPFNSDLKPCRQPAWRRAACFNAATCWLQHTAGEDQQKYEECISVPDSDWWSTSCPVVCIWCNVLIHSSLKNFMSEF